MLYHIIRYFTPDNSSFLRSSKLVDNTKTSITEAGQAAGTDHKDLSISASNQCVMMDALVRQMKDSCFYNYGGEEVYVEVASTYMTGFNLEANADEKKEDFVAYCDLGSMWD
mmetsp:Transcript_13469/g.22116  ORF Transcript_13469/g.22116 Transcript_13469/m.22116 type:complete len:112 (-) Transcript_13469:176-511(-)